MNYYYMMNPMGFPNHYMDPFEEFMRQYGDKSEDYILEEIMRVKNQVSPEVLQQYIHNIEYFSQMGGYITNEQRRKMDELKRILLTDTPQRHSKSNVESQSFGTSLLLWFLILVAIWPRPHYRPSPYPKPYPPRPFPFY